MAEILAGQAAGRHGVAGHLLRVPRGQQGEQRGRGAAARRRLQRPHLEPDGGPPRHPRGLRHARHRPPRSRRDRGHRGRGGHERRGDGC